MAELCSHHLKFNSETSPTAEIYPGVILKSGDERSFSH